MIITFSTLLKSSAKRYYIIIILLVIFICIGVFIGEVMMTEPSISGIRVFVSGEILQDIPLLSKSEAIKYTMVQFSSLNLYREAEKELLSRYNLSISSNIINESISADIVGDDLNIIDISCKYPNVKISEKILISTLYALNSILQNLPTLPPIKIESASNPTTIELKNSVTTTILIVALSSLISIFLGMGIATYLETGNRKIKNIKDLGSKDINCYGFINYSHNKEHIG